MEPVDEVKQAEAKLRKAEAELEKAQADEKAVINDVEKAVEELKEAEHRHHGEGLVRIYIDREVYESPSRPRLRGARQTDRKLHRTGHQDAQGRRRHP